MILPRDEDHPEHASTTEEPNVNLYMRIPDWKTSRQLPSKLAQILGLHLYSEVLLDKNARTEMNYAAIIIMVVGLFEFAAWAFLFNAIFNSDILRIGWGTVPAILLAVLFASAILWFERQFLTADEARGKRTRVAGMIRGLFILTSAFITAQPLELLFFRIPIEKRIHEEGIRGEAASKLSALIKENEEGRKFSDNKVDRRNDLIQGLEQQAKDVREEIFIRQSRLSSKESEQASWAGEAKRYRMETESAADPEARRIAQREYVRAETLRAAAARQVSRLNQEIAELNRSIEGLGAHAAETRQQAEELEDVQHREESEREQRLRNWIDQLKASEPRKAVEENGNPVQAGAGASSGPLWGKRWSYQDTDYDFFEQIRVVLDLAEGRPPRWRDASQGIRQKLEEGYGFARLSQEGPGRQGHLWAAIIACHLIALFIPFLVLCIKLVLMPAALRRYYSSRHQAEAGDQEAWLALKVEDQVFRNPTDTRGGLP